MTTPSIDSPDISARCYEIAAAFADDSGALLPALQSVQKEFGYIPAAGVAGIARALNLSRAEVHGVISFYPLLRSEPPGKRILQICRAEACQAVGARALEETAITLLGIDYHQTTADGRITLEPVYCLGNCACSPAVVLDNTLYSRVTPQRLREIIESENPGSEVPADE